MWVWGAEKQLWTFLLFLHVRVVSMDSHVWVMCCCCRNLAIISEICCFHFVLKPLTTLSIRVWKSSASEAKVMNMLAHYRGSHEIKTKIQVPAFGNIQLQSVYGLAQHRTDGMILHETAYT